MEETNRAKHGKSAQKSIEELLNRYAKLGYIKHVYKELRIGRDGFSNHEQFYAPFIIVYDDDTRWVIFSTTSMRTDRIKGQQWDSFNLKELDKSITQVYLVYPDEVTDKNRAEFVRQNEKYASNIEFSVINGIVSQEQISWLIEAYALRFKTDGQIKDAQGNGFEDRVAAILSYEQNFKKWKYDDKSLTGMHYDMYLNILNVFKLSREKVSKIEATADKKLIGRLPTGGNPKTDIWVKVTDQNCNVHNYTVSSKRSSSRSVSVHQYNADSFADVLDSNNGKLRSLLIEFQRCGSLASFGKENEVALTEELCPYNMKLALWALSGKYGQYSSDIQIADYILTYDNNKNSTHIMKIEEYIAWLISKKVQGNFGTIFTWTYPSKRRGLDIQLKCKLLLDSKDSD